MNASTGATVAEWEGLDAERAQRISDQNARELDDLLLQARKENAGSIKADDETAPEFSLSEVLGEPQMLTDLWPEHCYLPPKIAQLEKLIPIANQSRDAFLAGDYLQAMAYAVDFLVSTCYRDTGGTEIQPVTIEEVKNTQDLDEAAALMNHILLKQGLTVAGKRGQYGPLTGVRNFVLSADTTADTPSPSAGS